MKNNNFIAKIALTALSIFLFASCTGDLDRFPENDSTAQIVYSTFDGYKSAIAKVYAGYTLSGNTGPAGSPDIAGLDEGSNGDFLRCFFCHQELPTEEAHCSWNDAGIPELNNINFAADDVNAKFTIGLYAKCIMQIMYANEFLKNSTDGSVEGKGFTTEQIAEIKAFRAEARFLRAFDYWVLMDIFGNPPFITENDVFGNLPQQIQRTDLFDYIESELIDITDNKLLKSAKTNEYGRADEAAGWALLARIYLNAEIYKGEPKYTEAITYSKKVIDAGYSLKNNYEELFLADNNLNNNEVILSINYDGVSTRSYGGTTFLINGSSQGTYQSAYSNILIHYGIRGNNSNWAGIRTRLQLTEKFEQSDKRFLFVGENPAIADNPSEYIHGLATYKYRNITSESTVGNPVYGSDIDYSDTDFPLFRLAEMYLIYAEAVLRGGTGGTTGEALGYINLLRERAYGNASGNVSSINLEFILDERARELYWECFRRTDLIRYGLFTSINYLWEWKGGVQTGRAIDDHFNLYPIPSSDIMANPNLNQNDKY
ncbi:MAG: RagB/SusD family nutrient uptake outer membrane protein [Prevotellaceae bacterium]|jgi:hypothetical protein|nr:RagB/SusD family nutrient uptake outer membrane protein [Prevotellaceae bacterium]